VTVALRFLLVDDDVAFCEALSAGLRRRGHEVRLAHAVREGLSLAVEWEPDVSVIDLRLGGESGMELVGLLAAQCPQVTVLVLTGYGSIATAVAATKLGATQYLTKPVSVEDIIRAVGGHSQEDTSLAPSLDEVEWEHIQRVLNECEGNVSEAARRLRMHRRTLQRKLARGR
jgi:two-component system response regulator RegA